MSERTILPKSCLSVSRVGLGLAAIHLMNAARRRMLLESALDLGITHFDTARFYGDGLSEVSLGRMLGGRRRSLTVTTKFGLLPTPVIASLGRAAPLARKGRSVLKKLRLVEYPRRSYSRTTMRDSLQASLRALATDYIDIYSIHEPPADFVPAEDLIDDMIREKAKGRIRFIGVSGRQIDQFVRRFGNAMDVIQCAEGDWSAERFVPDITHSIFSSGGSRVIGAASARALLQKALARRIAGAVVVQTQRADHLREVMAWSERP